MYVAETLRNDKEFLSFRWQAKQFSHVQQKAHLRQEEMQAHEKHRFVLQNGNEQTLP